MATDELPPPADRVLLCVGCKQQFEWSGGEQQYYSSRGLAEPRRCKACREKRKRTDGIFGSRVVIVDSETDLVLCNKCRNPASRTFSLSKGEATCRACADPKEGATLSSDFISYEEWRNRKGKNPYVS